MVSGCGLRGVRTEDCTGRQAQLSHTRARAPEPECRPPSAVTWARPPATASKPPIKGRELTPKLCAGAERLEDSTWEPRVDGSTYLGPGELSFTGCALSASSFTNLSMRVCECVSKRTRVAETARWGTHWKRRSSRVSVPKEAAVPVRMREDACFPNVDFCGFIGGTDSGTGFTRQSRGPPAIGMAPPAL